MNKALVVYDTTFGNTKKLAEEIAVGIQETGGITCSVISHKDMKSEDVIDSDAVLFGSPIHAGMATRGIKGAIKKAAKIGLTSKIVTTFDTYASLTKSRGVKNMEKLLSKVVPDIKLITPGLSALVRGFRGPLDEAEIPKAHEFGRKIGQEILKED